MMEDVNKLRTVFDLMITETEVQFRKGKNIKYSVLDPGFCLIARMSKYGSVDLLTGTGSFIYNVDINDLIL